MRVLVCTLLLHLALLADAVAQQVADTSFNPEIMSPAYPPAAGPTVLIDEAHHNFHTAGGRYLPFAQLLRRDGYVVEPSRTRFARAALVEADILVISNALGEENVEDWSLPTASAFDSAEITAVRDWVAEGGALFLIADHMPMPGAAEELAAAFGILFGNGFVFDRDERESILVFRRADNSLAEHPIVRGRFPEERVDSVATFTGQGFRCESQLEPLLVLGSRTVLLLPEVAWEFSERTPRLSASGMLQGAVLRYARGRVAVFGEAAMFSAQRAGGQEDSAFGMNSPMAAQNPQFLLNVVHWLSGLLDDVGTTGGG